MKKVVLITGASHGLGKSIFEYLSGIDGYNVYGTSRNPLEYSLNNASNNQLLQLDVSKNESVRKCISSLIEKEQQIDVLINNVGINVIGSIEGTSMEEFEQQLNTNYLGTVRMIKAILPLFRKRNKGKIINVSSIGGSVPLPYNSAYAGAKAALDAMSESLAYELDGCGIFVSVIKPLGLTIEKETANIKYINSEKKWNKASKKLFEKMKIEVKPSVSKSTVSQVVENIIKLPKPKLNYTVGKGARTIILLHDLLSFKLFSRILKRNLF